MITYGYCTDIAISIYFFLKDIATIRAFGGNTLGLSLLQIQFQRKRKKRRNGK